MKERPIIMQAESVRAILDGRKTQTRRVVNPQPGQSVSHVVKLGSGFVSAYPNMKAIKPNDWFDHCPHGKPGDRLWVKEAWAMNTPPSGAIYKSGGEVRDQKWQSPLFMPRWASRITLELVNVRVERVQDISGPDIWAEGMTKEQYEAAPGDLAWYRELWQSIHGKNPARCWDANPWTWVLEFKRVKP